MVLSSLEILNVYDKYFFVNQIKQKIFLHTNFLTWEEEKTNHYVTALTVLNIPRQLRKNLQFYLFCNFQ